MKFPLTRYETIPKSVFDTFGVGRRLWRPSGPVGPTLYGDPEVAVFAMPGAFRAKGGAVCAQVESHFR
jgi:hypothetical protein